LTLLQVILLFVGGFAAGVLNIVAGGGSFLTLPILLWTGLPPTVANGTNRIAVALQNISATIAFARRGLIPYRWVMWATLPAMLTAPFGVWLAFQVPPDDFRRLLATLMILITLGTMLFTPKLLDLSVPEPPKWKLAGIFALLGIYTGFLQAGVGFMILGSLQHMKLNLVHGNAVKVCSILGATVVSLVAFAIAGDIAWGAGACLAGGTILGGQLGVRVAAAAGHGRLRIIVLLATIVFALLLWLS
jgi:uncharacterized membrane protein YfcA